MSTETHLSLAELPEGRRPLWSVKQLAKYYGVSEWTVLKWVREERMPTEPYLGTGKRFDFEQVQEWMAARDADRAEPAIA